MEPTSLLVQMCEVKLSSVWKHHQDMSAKCSLVFGRHQRPSLSVIPHLLLPLPGYSPSLLSPAGPTCTSVRPNAHADPALPTAHEREGGMKLAGTRRGTERPEHLLEETPTGLIGAPHISPHL